MKVKLENKNKGVVMMLNLAQYVIRTNEGIEAYKEDLLELFEGDEERAEKTFDKYVDALGKFVFIDEIIREAFNQPFIKEMEFETTELDGKIVISVAWIE
jgi:hypothetical protein